MPSPLRFTTWLSPSLPLELFAALADEVGAAIGRAVVLDAVENASGPVPGDDPFATGRTDVGFVCAPTWEWMSAEASPSAQLLGVAPVMDDPRAAGRPVYFSDVVVRDHSPARTFGDLAGGRWAYNDPHSLSGCLCLGVELSRRGLDVDFFATRVASGSHLRSLALVRAGRVDAAAIDSNVLALDGGEGLRVVESWGPYPIQPVLVRSALPEGLRRDLRTAFLGISADAGEWGRFRLRGFAPVDGSHCRSWSTE